MLLPCYTAVARLGFKRRAKVEFNSINLVRRGNSTMFETGLKAHDNNPLNALKVLFRSFQKCIEALIDKQYLERREGTKDEYTYMA